MKPYFLILFIHLFTHGHCNSDIPIGYKVTLAIPVELGVGISGRAFIIETNKNIVPNFRVGVSVESFEQKYSCSLDVFLGDIKVWSSGHFMRFFTVEKCVLELTQDGDLQLKGGQERIGWRAGTSGQGVQSLHLLRTGNLVLVDSLNLIKWQSFNFPTNVMLWGQRLNVATRLTSFPTNSTSFFSFEIERDKIALYLNSGTLKYSYWEFKPSENRNITFIKVGNTGLDLFGDKYTKISEIISSVRRVEPLAFLALGNTTGNLGLYYYSAEKGKFEASFQALNTTCDLPLACEPYGICTLSNVCSCIRSMSSGCSNGIPQRICGEKEEVEMIELEQVNSVLQGALGRTNMSKEECANLCLDDCSCASALYDSNSEECFVYGFVRGIKQVTDGTRSSYMVKVPKGIGGEENGKSSGLKKWVIVVVGVADGLVLLLVLGGVVYCIIHKRKSLQETENNS